MSAPLETLVVHHLRLARCGWRTERSPDRQVLTSEILPVFARRCATLLWVGVQRYTGGYHALLEQAGATCWTVDLDPGVAKWGHPERHLVCDVLQLPRTPESVRFAGVLCNGVLGYGIDGARAQAQAIERLAAVMEPGGWLLLGWNTHKCDDPLLCASVRRNFEPAPLEALPPRRRVPGTTHVFDILRRRATSP
jgi:hypothetical protein